MKQRSAAYQASQQQLATQPRYIVLFRHVPRVPSGTSYPFSRQFTSADDIVSATRPNLPWIVELGGGGGRIAPELGQSSVGTWTIGLLDVDGEVLRYCSDPQLTLAAAMNSTQLTATVSGTVSGLPSQGTIEITTGGVTERARYSSYNASTGVITLTARGVDGTVAAAHQAGDPVRNGEHIRAGQRVEIYAGYAELAQADYMLLATVDVVDRRLGPDGLTFLIECQDILATQRRTIFLTATPDAPVRLAGNPIDLALAILTSDGSRTALTGTLACTAESTTVTGTGTSFTTELAVGDVVRLSNGELLRVASIQSNTQFTAAQAATSTGSGLTGYRGSATRRYGVLDEADGLAIPPELVDVAGLELLRSLHFSQDRYVFRLDAPEEGKPFLESQIWQTLNCYPVARQDGRLSAIRYQPAPPPASVSETLTDDDLVSWSWQAGDRQIVNRLIVLYDWNLEAFPGVFAKRRQYTSTQSAQRHGLRRPLTIQAKGWWSADPRRDPMIDERAETLFERFAAPPPVLNAVVFYRKHAWDPGDLIKITSAVIPNPISGARGLTDEVFEIIDVQPEWGGPGRPAGLRLTLLDTQAITIPPAPDRSPDQDTGDEVPPPAVPTGLSVAQSGADVYPGGPLLPYVVLAWSPNSEPDLVAYDVRWSIQGQGQWAFQRVPAPQTSVKIVPLRAATTYEFSVRAVRRPDVASAWSSSVTALTVQDLPPATPTGLSLTASGDVQTDGTFLGLIDATWTANTETDLAGYEIQWRRQGTTSWSGARVGVMATPRFVIRSLPPATTFEVRVAAFDGAGNLSSFTATQLATTPADPGAPAVPTGLTATAFVLAVRLTWNENPETDVKAYDVQRADDAGFTTNVVTRRVDAVIMIDETGDAVTRYYRVRAVRRTGVVSAWSSSVTGAALKVGASHLVTDTAVITVGAQIASALIGTAHLQDASITSAKIADAAITSAKISNAAVVNAKIANAEIDQLKLNQSLSLQVGGFGIQHGLTATSAGTGTQQRRLDVGFQPITVSDASAWYLAFRAMRTSAAAQSVSVDLLRGGSSWLSLILTFSGAPGVWETARASLATLGFSNGQTITQLAETLSVQASQSGEVTIAEIRLVTPHTPPGGSAYDRLLYDLMRFAASSDLNVLSQTNVASAYARLITDAPVTLSTALLGQLAAMRAAELNHSGGTVTLGPGQTDSGWVLIADFQNAYWAFTADDRLVWHFRARLIATMNSGITTTVSIRLSDYGSGVILHESSITIPGSKTPPVGAAAWSRDFGVFRPRATGGGRLQVWLRVQGSPTDQGQVAFIRVVPIVKS